MVACGEVVGGPRGCEFRRARRGNVRGSVLLLLLLLLGRAIKQGFPCGLFFGYYGGREEVHPERSGEETR